MKYYEAYDDRYKIYHKEKGNAWAGDLPSKELKDILIKHGATENSSILEIGCGEGQNALFLLKEGFNLKASDVSSEAIKWCKENCENENLKNNFFVLDIVNNNFNEKFDFILSVSTLHMLVLDDDRKAFFDFIYSHLNDHGIAIITSMGDGINEQNNSDIAKAFDMVKRNNGAGEVLVPQTSCRKVNWENLIKEITNAHLTVVDNYISSTISGFNSSMIAIIKK